MEELFKKFSWKETIINFIIAFSTSFVIITTVKVVYPNIGNSKLFSSTVFLVLFYAFTRLRANPKIREILSDMLAALLTFPLLIFVFSSISSIFRNWYFVGFLGVVSILIAHWVRQGYGWLWRNSIADMKTLSFPFRKKKRSSVDESKESPLN